MTMKLRQQATNRITRHCRQITGSEYADLHIAIPHQKPPYIVSATEHPPIDDDNDNIFEGDHDLSNSVWLDDAYNYTGHQRYAVLALALNYVADLCNRATDIDLILKTRASKEWA